MALSSLPRRGLPSFTGEKFEIMRSALRAVKGLFSRRENEFDTAQPGPPRPLAGLFWQLTEIQKRKVLSYKGAEYAGGIQKSRRDQKL